MMTAAISAVVPRTRTIVVGRVTSVATHLRPWVRFQAVVEDGTGSLTLRFVGRRQIPGMVPGAPVRIEGTPMLERDGLVILNPLYQYLGPTPTSKVPVSVDPLDLVHCSKRLENK
jgi:hypothetical protein